MNRKGLLGYAKASLIFIFLLVFTYFLYANVIPVLAKSLQINGNSGSIWTTRDDCGDRKQDVNHYDIGEHVYINGANFNPGDYYWMIRGQPGGASCDPRQIVADGIFTVDESGSFCFDAYTVQPDDCGEYKVKFGNKGDNYRVVGAVTTTSSTTTTTSSTTTTPVTTTTTIPITTTTTVPVTTTTCPITTTTPATTTVPVTTTTTPATTTVPVTTTTTPVTTTTTSTTTTTPVTTTTPITTTTCPITTTTTPVTTTVPATTTTTPTTTCPFPFENPCEILNALNEDEGNPQEGWYRILNFFRRMAKLFSSEV